MSRRRFNRSERRVLDYIAEGLCEWCGDPLPVSWHADHVHPYSAGGPTTLGNGQALCPRCNLTKGSNVVTNTTRPLLRWQAAGQDSFFIHLDQVGSMAGKDGFALEATPGAGKTVFAADTFRKLFDVNRIDQALWVSPYAYTRDQAEADLGAYGLRTNSDAKTFPQAQQDVLLLTYSALSVPLVRELVARKARDRRMGVVLDEIHHAGRSKSWGDAVAAAFDQYQVKLLLSGTPFRSDGLRIPHFPYNANGEGNPHFVYDYATALLDDPSPVLPIYFPTWQDSHEPITYEYAGERRSCTFDDVLPDRELADRLNMALDMESSRSMFLRSMLQAALRKLSEVRRMDPKAALLVVAIDITHAKDIVSYLRSLGERPVLVVSRDDELDVKSKSLLDAFKDRRTEKDEDQKILVTVRMVSEGVDIPRIRGIVWATNVTERLLFRQVVGRAVRAGDRRSRPFMFIPADPRLMEHVSEIKQIVKATLGSESPSDLPDREPAEADRPKNRLYAISSSGELGQTLDHEGEVYDPADVVRAEHALRQNPDLAVGLTAMDLAKLMRSAALCDPSPAVSLAPPVTDTDLAKESRAFQARLVREIANDIIAYSPGRFSGQESRAYALVNGEANRRMHVETLDQLGNDLDKLARRRKHLEDMADDVDRGRGQWWRQGIRVG